MTPILAHWITGHLPTEHDLDEAVRLEGEADSWRTRAAHIRREVRWWGEGSPEHARQAEDAAEVCLTRSRHLSRARADGRAHTKPFQATAPLRLAA